MNTEVLDQKNNDQTWGLAGTLLWGCAIALLYVIVQSAVALVYIQMTYGEISEELIDKLEFDATVFSLSTIFTFIIVSIALCGVIKLKKNADLRSYLALNRSGVSDIRYWVVATLIFIAISDTVTYLLGKPIVPEFMSNIYDSTDHLWLLLIALVVAAPVFEELFFRGFLISGLSSTFMGPLGAVFLTSISWAVIHVQYDLYGVFIIFIVGILLGVARLKTNSLFVPIIMHAIILSLIHI